MIGAALLFIASALAAGAAASSAMFIVGRVGVGLTATYGFYAVVAFISFLALRQNPLRHGGSNPRHRALKDMVG